MLPEYISKPSREPLFPPSLPSSFSLPPDTPLLAVRWSKAVDRGVRPLISKHSRGAYGENAAEYSLQLCRPANSGITGCQLVDVNR